MDASAAPQLIILFILILLSAFFSSAETSLTTVNKIRMQNLEEEGNKNARLVLKLIESPGKLLTMILIGNNVVNLSASSLTTIFATQLFTNMGFSISVSTGVGIATGVLTLLILMFGEIVPKTLATIYSESLSLRYARILYALNFIMTPLIFIINKISFAFLILIGADAKAKEAKITENELLRIIEVSHEEGVIESEEREMIHNVVDFGDSFAKDVMVPRIDVTFCESDATYDEISDLFKKEKFSRIPVFEDTKDNVVGIVNVKDLFYYEGSKEHFQLQDIMREPFFTYEYQKTSDLMLQMRQQSINIAIILDEYGAVAGLVTMEDLLEEIVGEIRDEYDDEEEEDVRKISDNEYLAVGSARLDDISDLLDIELESEDIDSIAGYLIDLLGHIPTEGETAEDDYIRMRVDQMDKNRVELVHIYIKEENNLLTNTEAH